MDLPGLRRRSVVGAASCPRLCDFPDPVGNCQYDHITRFNFALLATMVQMVTIFTY